MCSYKDSETNETVFLSNIMIINETLLDIGHKSKTNKLLKKFESPVDILILKANASQSNILMKSTIEQNREIEASVLHIINFH